MRRTGDRDPLLTGRARHSRETEKQMARCVICGEETLLWVSDQPLCIKWREATPRNHDGRGALDNRQESRGQECRGPVSEGEEKTSGKTAAKASE